MVLTQASLGSFAEYLGLWIWGAMEMTSRQRSTQRSICVKDASGPYHYEFRQHLVALAEEQALSV